jgi:hypothetical protein
MSAAQWGIRQKCAILMAGKISRSALLRSCYGHGPFADRANTIIVECLVITKPPVQLRRWQPAKDFFLARREPSRSFALDTTRQVKRSYGSSSLPGPRWRKAPRHSAFLFSGLTLETSCLCGGWHHEKGDLVKQMSAARYEGPEARVAKNVMRRC